MQRPLGNEKLGIVEDARRRREHYRHYVDRRVAAAVDSEPTRHEIERLVGQRVTAEIGRLVRERAEARLRDAVDRLVVSEGPPAPDILKAVAAASGFTLEQMIGPRRGARLARARHVAVLLLSDLRPDLTMTAIGRLMGNRDHTSILHARNQARRRIANPADVSGRWYAESKARLGR